MAVDRETLYQQVWAEPMTKVGAQYGVSSSYLARICERLNVPRPARGYWAQLEVGKAPGKPELPEARPADMLVWSRDGELPRAARRLPRPPAEQPRQSQRKSSAQPKQHPLLVGARKYFDNARESDRGYLRPTKRRLVDLFVSKATLDRALEVANRLYRALEAKGHQVTLAPLDQHLWRRALDERSAGGRPRDDYASGGPDRPTVVYVGTVAIGLTLFELSEEIEVQYVDGRYVPVREAPLAERVMYSRNGWTHKRDMPRGKLCLRASSPYGVASWEQQWREKRKGELASKVRLIVQELESSAAPLSRLVEEGERQAEIQRREWELQQEKWRREEAERRRLQNVKESREQLGAIIAAWSAARQVEAFFEDVERRAESLTADDRESLLDRVRQARALFGGVNASERLLGWKAPEDSNSGN